MNAHTRFPTTVRPPDAKMLKSGYNNRKLGGRVNVGPHKGAVLYSLSMEERASCPEECLVWDTCMVPDTLVLMGDASWKRLGDLTPGEEIVGFDEDAIEGHRKYRRAYVQAVDRSSAPVYEVETSKGSVVCTADHLWLARRNRKGYVWVRTEDLMRFAPQRKGGVDLAFCAQPWTPDLSYDSGRLRGFMEGEGTLCLHDNGGHPKARVSWAQKNGPLAEEMLAVGARLGFEFKRRSVRSGVGGANMLLAELQGGVREVARFMGTIRPSRLMDKASDLWEGNSIRGRGSEPAKLISVISRGIKPIVLISTSTKTLIGNGFLVHNCYGNNMPFAHRYDHTHPDFFKQLYGAVQRLCASHKKVLLRLHVLGDFFSVEYVRFWYAILEEFPELHLFGYTAHPVTSAIGKEIHNMTLHYGWHRVAIRFSGHAGPRGAVVNSTEGVTCPEQTGHVPSCAECGACWNGEDLINFLEH